LVHAKVDLSSGHVYAIGACTASAPSSAVDEYFLEDPKLSKGKRKAPTCAMSKSKYETQK
jgi:hypothetical protein